MGSFRATKVSAVLIATFFVMAAVSMAVTIRVEDDSPCDAAYIPTVLREKCKDVTGWWAPIPLGDCCPNLVDAGVPCVCNTLQTELVDPTIIDNYLTQCAFPPGTVCPPFL